jgi:acetyl-CoA synthetase
MGRADDTMNLGGIKVSAREIENVIDAHDAVYESAAIAVQPEGEGADRLVVYGSLRQATDADTLHRELSHRVKGNLNPVFKIHDVVTIDALPRTASNKVMRRELRARYANQTA